MPIPPSPIFLSSQLVDFNTKYTKARLMIMPTKMFNSSYSALMEIRVVNVPAPAIRGKAIGTTEVLLTLIEKRISTGCFNQFAVTVVGIRI